ncbi:conserved hypothetical protein [Magnetospirillum sp. LM-5]|jgi:hypothetical protein|uniref:Uncharacterized protein n=1 Tax=Paramagnetospirillum magnetotacticum MS-1 TaxID=272627 RepID=A0A0C2UVA4_PARME|nr:MULTISPECIES: hypothetical protein [Rhodospirillales]KIL96756.1 hypothetical protein CCC_01622 [Paramagnetospirillum magnetotacticum MS-1]CAA7622141.1 conserved hypothetical protein [Magnetospirillum sp. LM-5]
MLPWDILIAADDHVDIGNSIKDAQEQILIVTRYAPDDSSAHREAVAALASLERLRTVLDNLLHQQVGDHLDPRGLRPLVYFTDVRFRIRSDNPVSQKQDAFIVWAVEG